MVAEKEESSEPMAEKGWSGGGQAENDVLSLTVHGSRPLAAIYARVSTEEQARGGHSLPAQLAIMREYAVREGYEVAAEIVDPGYSGTNLRRPAIGRTSAATPSSGPDAPRGRHEGDVASASCSPSLVRAATEQEPCREAVARRAENHVCTQQNGVTGRQTTPALVPTSLVREAGGADARQSRARRPSSGGVAGRA